MKLLKPFALAAALSASLPHLSVAADVQSPDWSALDKITRDLGLDTVDTLPNFEPKNGELVLTKICNRASGCTPFTGHVTLEQYLCAESALGVQAGRPATLQAKAIGCAP